MSTTAVHGGKPRTGDVAVRRLVDVDNAIRRVRIACIRKLLVVSAQRSMPYSGPFAPA